MIEKMTYAGVGVNYDAMYRLTGKSYYDHIAQDTVAMIVNDMITLGALPLSVAMHLPN